MITWIFIFRLQSEHRVTPVSFEDPQFEWAWLEHTSGSSFISGSPSSHSRAKSSASIFSSQILQSWLSCSTNFERPWPRWDRFSSFDATQTWTCVTTFSSLITYHRAYHHSKTTAVILLMMMVIVKQNQYYQHESVFQHEISITVRNTVKKYQESSSWQ